MYMLKKDNIKKCATQVICDVHAVIFMKNYENFDKKALGQNFAVFPKSVQKCFSRNSLFLSINPISSAQCPKILREKRVLFFMSFCAKCVHQFFEK